MVFIGRRCGGCKREVGSWVGGAGGGEKAKGARGVGDGGEVGRGRNPMESERVVGYRN